jgi:hypothetical protein
MPLQTTPMEDLAKIKRRSAGREAANRGWICQRTALRTPAQNGSCSRRSGTGSSRRYVPVGRWRDGSRAGVGSGDESNMAPRSSGTGSSRCGAVVGAGEGTDRGVVGRGCAVLAAPRGGAQVASCDPARGDGDTAAGEAGTEPVAVAAVVGGAGGDLAWDRGRRFAAVDRVSVGRVARSSS